MKITPYSKNAKMHGSKQIEQIADSIKEFGMNQQIVVDKQGVIIVGHGRYEALKSLGMEVKKEWIKVVDLTEEQAKSYRLADNKLNESDWDMGLVIEELKGLSETYIDLTGFDKDLIINNDDEADFTLPTEGTGYEQITFTLTKMQADFIKECIVGVKKTDEYKAVVGTGQNDNSNGNAVYLIAKTWVQNNLK